MAFTYEIKPNSGDSHQTSPDWMMVVIRYKFRSTFNPASIKAGLDEINAANSISPDLNGTDIIQNNAGASQTYTDYLGSGLAQEPSLPANLPAESNPLNSSLPDANTNPVQELDPIPLIIDESISNWSINNGKSEHVKSMNISLFNDSLRFGFQSWGKELCPGDWMLFYSFDNAEDKARVKQKIQLLKPANLFNDGLKFMGRIKGVKKIRTRSQNGLFTVTYQLSANSFQEFDSIIYFNSIMTSKYANEPLQWMIDLSQAANNFILNANSNGGINSNTAIPGLIQICLGLGPTGNIKGLNEKVASSFDPGSPESNSAAQTQTTPNVSYRIPNSIATLMGVKSDPKANSVGFTYSDLLNLYIGVQGFTTSSPSTSNLEPLGDAQWEPFVPFNLDPLDGDFYPYTININQSTVWSLIGNYLNQPINEHFTSLRVTSDGSIQPCYIARQLPFSSTLFNRYSDKSSTAFMDLPRWKIHEELVVSDQLGTSDALRQNFVHMLGQDTRSGDSFYNSVLTYTRHPPIVDVVDILRNGLFPMEQPVSANDFEASYSNNNSPGRFWTLLMADICINNHLRWTGIIETKGIQAPIAEGDNLEYDGGLYHIERITHSGSVNPSSGIKTFNTSIHVSHGLSLLTDTDPSGYNVYLTNEFSTEGVADPAGPGLTIE